MRASCLLVIGLIAGTASAQRATLATGNEASGAGGTMSYSIGQIDHQFQSAQEGTVAQGVQQPYEFLVLVTPEPPTASIAAALLPNPTSDAVTLRLQSPSTGPLHWELYNANGRLLRTANITATDTRIPMDDAATGEYLLHVVQHGTPLSITKIIKH